MPGHTADGTHADCSMCAKLLLLLLLEEPGKAKEVCMRPALVFKVVQPLLKLYGEYTVSSISSYLAPFPLPPSPFPSLSAVAGHVSLDVRRCPMSSPFRLSEPTGTTTPCSRGWLGSYLSVGPFEDSDAACPSSPMKAANLLSKSAELAASRFTAAADASVWSEATRNSPSQKQSYPEKLSASAGVLLQSIVKRLRDDVPSLRAAVGVELYLMVDLRQLKIILIVEIDDLKDELSVDIGLKDIVSNLIF
ncbi:hypothetical protein BHM03_00048906 [Ensete ventricosum]|uniref:Uncharacterized protein n=1 Tax=Ensete ventricosum TaxID=4639 RepID=A0A445MLH0_ENSVE|nr:hypothetical protein BHM03_00048906 [Ensete ventricosum]